MQKWTTAPGDSVRRAPLCVLSGASDLNVARIAEESCKIVGTSGFYPERKVCADYIERYTPIMLQRLVIAAARLGAMLNMVFR